MQALNRFRAAQNQAPAAPAQGYAPPPVAAHAGTPAVAGRGRFAGVKAADNRYPLIPTGEFRLRVLETYVTRNPKTGEWYHADFEVIDSNVPEYGPGSKLSWLQGMSGKSEAVGLPKIKRFCMAAVGTEDEAAYDAQDPQGDLIDATCGIAVPGIESNPLAGAVVDCSATPGKTRQDGRSFSEYAFMLVQEDAQA
jgi:hypothetical protein